MRPSLLLVGILGSLGTAACTGNFATEGPDAEAASTTAAAVVVVSRSSGPGDAVRDDSVVARFVRVTKGTLDENALRTAGVAQDLPAVGECRTDAALIRDEKSSGSRELREIDLADVGVVTLESGKSTPLVSRSVPDPTGRISGVLYSARSAEVFASGARMQLRASGGSLPEGFAVSVAAPHDLADVHASTTSSGLDVSWESADEGHDETTHDLVYLDVLDRNARLVTRCTTTDGGRFLVPSTELRSVDEGQVVVHRLHNEGFRAKGVEPGEVRFDVARVVGFKR